MPITTPRCRACLLNCDQRYPGRAILTACVDRRGTGCCAVDAEDGLGTICWGSSVPTAVPTSDEACIATLSIVFDSAGAGGTRAGSCTVIAIGNCFGFEGQFAPPAPSPATLRWYHPHAHFTAIGIRRPQFTREAFDVSLDTGP